MARTFLNSLAIPASTVVTTDIADNAVTLAKLAGGTDGNIISFDASGDPVAIATGSNGQVLTSTGAGSPPAFEAVPVGGITVADQWRINSSLTGGSANTFHDITANWEQVDTAGQGTIGTAMSNSSGIFTFPSTGIYLVQLTLQYSTSSSSYIRSGSAIAVTVNNSSYTRVAINNSSHISGSPAHAIAITQSLVDVTNVSNVKAKFQYDLNEANQIIFGSSTINYTFATFTRLGDT